MNNKLIDLTGQTFGIWRVVSQAPRRDNKTRWLCECVTCGTQRPMRSTVLRAGKYSKCFGSHNFREGSPSPLKKSSGYAAETEIFNNYRTRAPGRGLIFALTREQFHTITQSNCDYCGAPPAQRFRRRHFNGAFIYNGIDRVDSSKGYELGNCVAACSTCNVMKQDLSAGAFLAHISKILKRHKPPVTAPDERMSMGRGGNFRTPNIVGSMI